MTEWTDDELRGLVRAAVARARGVPEAGGPSRPLDVCVHPSHSLLPSGRGGDADGNCVIEPAVRCTHCGYCQSYGH